MRPSTYLRLALLGSRVDALRVVLTAAGSALATLGLLAAATVASIQFGDGPYSSALLDEPGLRPGVTITLALTCVPVFVLLAQCSRIGTPAHHRRLAALRLAGATPRQVTRIVTAGAGAGASFGALLGLVLYAVLRAVLDNPSGVATDRGPRPVPVLPLPTDVVPAWPLLLGAVLVVPIAVVAGTSWSLRRIVVTPFEVLRRTRTRPPRFVPAIATVVGVAVFFVSAAILARLGDGVPRPLIFGLLLIGFLLASGGLLAGQGAVAFWMGRWLAQRTSRPALLLAARRMIADPFAATRSTAVLTVAVLVAAGARHLRDVTEVMEANADPDFYRSSYDLVDLTLALAGLLAALGLLVASAEGVVARRRTYAAVVAAGMPRRVVGRSVLAELLLPLVPSLLAAAAVGTVAAFGLFGRTVALEHGSQTVGVAWGPLTVTIVGALTVTGLTTAAGLLFLRRATDISELRAAA